MEEDKAVTPCDPALMLLKDHIIADSNPFVVRSVVGRIMMARPHTSSQVGHFKSGGGRLYRHYRALRDGILG